MGILSTLLKNTIGNATADVSIKACDVGIKACDAANKKVTESNEKKIDKFFQGVTDGHSRLIIAQKPYTFKESFKIEISETCQPCMTFFSHGSSF